MCYLPVVVGGGTVAGSVPVERIMYTNIVGMYNLNSFIYFKIYQHRYSIKSTNISIYFLNFTFFHISTRSCARVS